MISLRKQASAYLKTHIQFEMGVRSEPSLIADHLNLPNLYKSHIDAIRQMVETIIRAASECSRTGTGLLLQEQFTWKMLLKTPVAANPG